MIFRRPPFLSTAWTGNTSPNHACGTQATEQIHDLDWTNQFDIRYCHLHGAVVGIQVPGAGYGIPFPVGVVCRGFALADTHRSHDPHPQGSVHPEFCLMACDADDLLHHGNRPLYSVHLIRQFDRLTPLPWTYFPWLIGILLSYCVLTQWLKTPLYRGFQTLVVM